MTARNEKRLIQTVNDRADKQKTYHEMMQRYKKAFQNEFYFEAIMIDYACMEDRLRYMLFYLGVLTSEKDYKITGNSRRIKEFRHILHEHKGEKANMGIQSIAGKRQIVQSVFLSVAVANVPEDTKSIRFVLWNTLHDDSHIRSINSILDEMAEWCGYRNEIVHSMLNKNLESLYEKLKEQAEKGYELFRRMDQQVQWVKRKKLREKLGLQD